MLNLMDFFKNCFTSDESHNQLDKNVDIGSVVTFNRFSHNLYVMVFVNLKQN